jgi:hypothetical protein
MIGIFHNPRELETLSDDILPLDPPQSYRKENDDQNSITNAKFAFKV